MVRLLFKGTHLYYFVVLIYLNSCEIVTIYFCAVRDYYVNLITMRGLLFVGTNFRGSNFL
jgi:hypothetical protein